MPSWRYGAILLKDKIAIVGETATGNFRAVAD